jgi:hypothetical protein
MAENAVLLHNEQHAQDRPKGFLRNDATAPNRNPNAGNAQKNHKPPTCSCRHEPWLGGDATRPIEIPTLVIQKKNSQTVDVVRVDTNHGLPIIIQLFAQAIEAFTARCQPLSNSVVLALSICGEKVLLTCHCC